MPNRKISTTVYITAEQDRALKALNAESRVPVAEYIRQGIDMILAVHAGEDEPIVPVYPKNGDAF